MQTEQEQAETHEPKKLDAAACFQTPMCSSKRRVLRHAAAAHAWCRPFIAPLSSVTASKGHLDILEVPEVQTLRNNMVHVPRAVPAGLSYQPLGQALCSQMSGARH